MSPRQARAPFLPWWSIAMGLAAIAGCGTLQNLVCTLVPCWCPSNNLALMSEAERIVAQEYPTWLLIEAQGAPSTGSASVADDVDQWRFIFVDDPNDTQDQGTVELQYADGAFGQPVYVPDIWLGTVFERLPRHMSLAQAIEHMRDAGYTQTFTAVDLRKPLKVPLPEEAFYIFTLPDRYVLVGAVTGKVTEETRN
ncbi:MAG: hypothetical protein JXQ73_10795 [Phycisphaerae bacterium]|nr:hypothetical protein [Phycisphaerae bacterium]